MPSTLGTTTVSLRAETQNFNRNIAAAQTHLQRLSRTFRSSTINATKFLGALALGTGAIGQFIRGGARAATRLRELALATNVSVERLQQLQRIFEADGVSAEQFRRGMLRLLRTLGRAARGERDSFEVFEELEIAIRNANGEVKKLDTVLLEIIQNLAGKAPAIQQGFLADLFGRTSILLQAGFGRLSTDADAYTKELERQRELLPTITEAESIRLKAAEQSFTDLGNALETYNQKLTATFQEDFTRAIEGFIRHIESNFGKIEVALRIFGENVDLLIKGGLLFFFRRFAFAVGAATISLAAFTKVLVVAGIRLFVGALALMYKSIVALVVAIKIGLVAGLRAFYLALALATRQILKMGATLLLTSRAAVIGSGSFVTFGKNIRAVGLGLIKVTGGLFLLAAAGYYAAEALEGNFGGIEDALENMQGDAKRFLDGFEKILNITPPEGQVEFDTASIEELEGRLAAARKQVDEFKETGPVTITIAPQLSRFQQDLRKQIREANQQVEVLNLSGAAADKAKIRHEIYNSVLNRQAEILKEVLAIEEELRENVGRLSHTERTDLEKQLEKLELEAESLLQLLRDPDLGELAPYIDELTRLRGEYAKLQAETRAAIEIDVEFRPQSLRNAHLQAAKELEVLLGDRSGVPGADLIVDALGEALSELRRIQQQIDENVRLRGIVKSTEEIQFLNHAIARLKERAANIQLFLDFPEDIQKQAEIIEEIRARVAKLNAENEVEIEISVVYTGGSRLEEIRKDIQSRISDIQLGPLENFNLDKLIQVEVIAALEELDRVQQHIAENMEKLKEALPIDEAALLRAEIDALQSLELDIQKFIGDPEAIQAAAENVLNLINQYRSLTQVQKFADDAARAFTSSLGSVILGAKSGREAVRGFIVSLADLVLQYTVLIPLAQQLSAAIQGSISGSAGSIQGAATGGLRRGITLVGERGPELVDLGSGSRVYTNEQLASAVGTGGQGVTVVNEFNISSTDGAGVRKALAEALPVFTQTAMAKVMDESTRPGQFRRVTRGF